PGLDHRRRWLLPASDHAPSASGVRTAHRPVTYLLVNFFASSGRAAGGEAVSRWRDVICGTRAVGVESGRGRAAMAGPAPWPPCLSFQAAEPGNTTRLGRYELSTSRPRSGNGPDPAVNGSRWSRAGQAGSVPASFGGTE